MATYDRVTYVVPTRLPLAKLKLRDLELLLLVMTLISHA